MIIAWYRHKKWIFGHRQFFCQKFCLREVWFTIQLTIKPCIESRITHHVIYSVRGANIITLIIICMGHLTFWQSCTYEYSCRKTRWTGAVLRSMYLEASSSFENVGRFITITHMFILNFCIFRCDFRSHCLLYRTYVSHVCLIIMFFMINRRNENPSNTALRDVGITNFIVNLCLFNIFLSCENRIVIRTTQNVSILWEMVTTCKPRFIY